MGGNARKKRQRSRGKFSITLSATDRAAIAQAGALCGILDQRTVIMAAISLLKNYAMQQIEARKQAAQANEGVTDGSSDEGASVSTGEGDESDSDVSNSNLGFSEQEDNASNSDSVPSPS